MGEDKHEDDETGGRIGGGAMREIHYFIRMIALLGETFTRYSLLSHGGEIKGPVSSFVLPSFM